MTMIDTMSSQNSIYNPDRKPLEEVKIKTLVDGQYMDIPALDKHWMVEEREFTLYSAPPSDGDALGLGAKEAWLERMGYLNADFRWLLHLEHHRFWSQIALDGGRAVGGVEQFLQEAHPLYATDSFPTTDDQMVQIYQEALHLAFLVMCRIICEKESDREWIRRETLAQLWYSKYIITLPMLFDMCLLYGDGNTKLLTKLVKTVFDIQPLYKDDLKNAVCFIGERLSLMQDKLNTRKVAEQHHPAKLFERDFNSKSELSLANLSDLILYLLDSMLNLATILFIYQPACPILHSLRFETKIVSFYEHTIPSINEQLAQLSKKDDTIDIYFDLKYKLDVVRVQMIKIFRNCLFSPINSMIELTNIRSKSADQIKVYIEDFISTLSEFLADKLFIQDYHKAYPVDQDLEILSQVYPDLDSLKCDFLMESVWSCYDVPPLPPAHNGGTSSTSQQQYLGPSKSAKTEAVRKPNSVELESLVTQVKDLLPHLGDGFIQKCLEHYRYDSATVINAVLESTLPDSLCSLDFNMPAEQLPAHTKNATNNLPLRVNVFDNDEFDIMTRDSIDTSRVHKGKWKMKYKNLNEMLDDKSHVAELKEQFTKLGFVEGEEDVYDDEYDDTYDGLDVSVGEAGEPERRQFVTPRVLENRTGAGGRGGRREEDVDSGGEEEEEDNEEEEDGGRANRDSFVENPEVVRARLERQRQNKYQSREGAGPPASSRNVTGKPKGQGQEKRVVENRDRKNTGKAYVGNHNRRNMAQRKRNQGMMPS